MNPTELNKEIPMIITLCGSARFEQTYRQWDLALTLAGHAVFGLTAYPSDHGGKDWYDADTKKRLDIAHMRKIDASDIIVVLNVDAYIGESALSEIHHARSQGMVCHFLESWGEGNGPFDKESVSPIKTFGGLGGHPLNSNVWVSKLLGQGGPFRSNVLLPIVKAEEQHPIECGSVGCYMRKGACTECGRKAGELIP